MKNKIVSAMGAVMMATTAVMPAAMPMQVFAAEAKDEAVITVTYEDGCENTVFEPIQIEVKKGVQIPDAGLDPVREGFLFKGWSPAVTGTATEDVIYVAQWTGDDSLTAEDRAAIKEKADKTKSTVSVEDVGGEVVAGKVGKDDSYTEDVDTGDLNVPLVLGVGAGVLVLSAGAMFVLKKRQAEK